MRSLKLWLNKIKRNQDGNLATHWEIEVVISQLITMTPCSLLEEINPILLAIKDKTNNHKHKSLMAEFALKLIDQWEELDKLDPF